ncbi:MAG: hypothetical protein LBH05_02370 [Deferribacteraceae bacterium]|jgi:hypothetical protein|nr:hypothetical protein [Deferribacteraceae bacterium]
MRIEEALIETLDEILKHRMLSSTPVYADKQEMARILGISTRTLDRLVCSQRLIEEKHYTRFTDGGHPMFVVKLVVAELKPSLAKLEEMI